MTADLCCDLCGSHPCQCPTVRALHRPKPDAVVTFDQDEWWQTADGLTVTIDSMTDSHRINVAALLVRTAPAYYFRKRVSEEIGSYWSYVDHAVERGWPFELEEPTNEELAATIHGEVEAGKHLEWVRGTKLFRRMIRDIDPMLLRSGTLRHEAQRVAHGAPADF